MRSKLFVPGSRPELFAKAFAGDADAISIDLEDAVVESRKGEARNAVRDWLKSHGDERDERDAGASVHSNAGSATGTFAGDRARKLVIVRVNAMDTPHFHADLDAIVQPGLHVLNLPKPESAGDVRAASEALRRAELANGVAQPIALLLNIETPRALREAASIAAADPRVFGLQVGLGDLFEPFGIDRRDVGAVHHVLFAVRMAAAEAGVAAFDGAFANVKDTDGFIAEARMARRLGFAGKSCIHPSQVALANEAFRPSEEEVAHATRVAEAAKDAEVRGLGAFVVDGRMVDRPFLLRAQAVLAAAHRLGLPRRGEPS